MCDICNGMTHEQFRRRTLARIAERDYTLIAVAGERRGRVRAPGFTYSIGLWTFRQVPEVIVVGAPCCCATKMIEAYVAQAAAGWRFAAGRRYDYLVGGGPVVLERVSPARYEDWFARAFHLYPDGQFPALQMLWPDARGVWPWDVAWSRGNVEPQPLLTRSGRPESFRPGDVLGSGSAAYEMPPPTRRPRQQAGRSQRRRRAVRLDRIAGHQPPAGLPARSTLPPTDAGSTTASTPERPA